MTKMTDEWVTYLMLLEKERNDLTHVQIRTKLDSAKERLSDSQVRHIKALVDAEIAQLRSMREQRDKLFYNAGRWAGGARDEIAVSSNNIVDALLGDEN